MGFFSNLKNAVTGGAATVRVQAPSAQRGQAVPIQIEAVAKANGQVNAVYVLVRATESATIHESDHVGPSKGETAQGRKVAFETRINVAGAQQIESGQVYRWEGQLSLPATVNPTFRGQMIQHHWEIQAGLDMRGNDPDSGWQPIDVA